MKKLNEFEKDLTVMVKSVVIREITKFLRKYSRSKGRYIDLCWWTKIPSYKIARNNVTRYRIIETEDAFIVHLFNYSANLINEPVIIATVEKLDYETYHETLVRKAECK